MNVRTASGDDVPVVTELWVALAREQRDHGSHLLPAENREQARDLVAQYVHADGIGVATLDGTVQGFVMFHVETGFFETDATRGVVDNVYVVPAARNDGVGSALLDYAEAELADRGVDVVAVEALWGNEDARRLYERRGYDPHRVTVEQSLGDGSDSDGVSDSGDGSDSDGVSNFEDGSDPGNRSNSGGGSTEDSADEHDPT